VPGEAGARHERLGPVGKPGGGTHVHSDLGATVTSQRFERERPFVGESGLREHLAARGLQVLDLRVAHDEARLQGLSLTATKTRASRGRRLLQQQLVACCRVSLSAQGEVLDYNPQEAAKCAPRDSGCKARRAH
jgi:hypothetical protein